jgi:SAM-dependent methyltransferase
MSWDSTWEAVFAARDWGRYPPEELVGFIGRRFSHAVERRDIRILELGCGTGANVWFLAREGFDVCGIDGSASAIDRADRRLASEKLASNLKVGDVEAASSYFDGGFDAILDVACIQHNDYNSASAIVLGAYGLLKPGGAIFSMMLATESADFCTKVDGSGGHWVKVASGPGQEDRLLSCHLVTREQVAELFGGFCNVRIDYSTRSSNNGERLRKYWVIEAERQR